MCLATALYHLLRRPNAGAKGTPCRASRHLLLLIPLLLLLLLPLLATRHLPVALPSLRDPVPPAPLHLPRCANALVFTGARQGSTWFLDSIERCAFSVRGPPGPSGARRFASDVFRRTELWKHFGEPALDGTDLSPGDALEYIVRNTSVKIFPSVFWRRRDDVAVMLEQRQRYNLTILVLRRAVAAAWDSWQRATASSVWNGAVHQAERAVNESERAYFFESRERYDAGVEALLAKMHVPYDVFDYDEARRLPLLIAGRNGCYISNCNFAPPPGLPVARGEAVRDGDLDVDVDAEGEAGEDADDPQG